MFLSDLNGEEGRCVQKPKFGEDLVSKEIRAQVEGAELAHGMMG